MIMKNKEIKTEIDDELRQKGRYTKSLSDELYASYEDELSSLKEEGVSEDEAREEAKRSLMSSMEELPAKPGRKYAFAILISLFFFLLTFGELIIANVSSSMVSPMLRYVLIEFLFALGWLIYGICTHRKRRTLDYIVLGVLFVSLLVSLIETSMYAFAADTGDRVWEYNYIYPCIFRAILHARDSSGGMGEAIVTHTLFYPQEIVSFASLVTSLIIFFIKKEKRR